MYLRELPTLIFERLIPELKLQNVLVLRWPQVGWIASLAASTPIYIATTRTIDIEMIGLFMMWQALLDKERNDTDWEKAKKKKVE